MNLEPITQNEISQKKKDKYRILTYIQNLEECTEELIYRAAVEKQAIENRLMDIGKGEERMRYIERVTWKLTFSSVQSLSYIQLFATS